MSDSFLDELDEPIRPKSKKPKPGSFSDPTANLRPGAAMQATVKKSLRAGKYIRRQFTFRPEQLGRIRGLARQYRVPEADLMRWMVDYALAAIDDGVQPDTIEVSTTRLASPLEGK